LGVTRRDAGNGNRVRARRAILMRAVSGLASTVIEIESEPGVLQSSFIPYKWEEVVKLYYIVYLND